VTDIVMPEMGGRELAERLRAEDPTVRVVFVSGFAERGGRAPSRAPLEGPFLAKPFSGAELARAVRSALDVRSADPGPTGR
jgi:CheY-like chemotaxis protein